GGGLLVCLIPMMTMLPVLLLRGRQNRIDHDEGQIAERRARIENLWLQRPLIVTCVTIALCALAATQVPKVYFDYNLLHMQSAGLPAVEFETKLLNSADKSVLFGAVIATNQQDADALMARLTNLPAVAGVESITKYLGDDQTQQLKLVRQIKAELASITFDPPDRQPVEIPELSQTLYSLYGYLGAAGDEVQKDEPALAKQLASLRQAVGDLRKRMLQGTAAQVRSNSVKLAAYQQALFNDVRQTFQALKNQDSESPLRIEDLPQALRDRFVGVTGKYLLMVYPKKDVWKRENQREFIEQVQGIYPNVTGTPVQLYYYTDLLKRSYEEAARYSLAAIVLLVLFHFRSALCVALALVPVGVGFIWLGGLMGFFDVQLNPANIMTLPLVIGIGVTNGIHILNRYAEEQTPNILARSTGKAVLVSGLTAIAGFGSLTLAKHQGIQSLGYVMSCGLATCMIAGLTFLPALLNVLTRRPAEKGRPSADKPRAAPGREEPKSKTSSLRID
ncbi:MAG TPA: MMPL family transporter, partial [Patescibacteria group bacterium]|nr:MMPL family transporter [Patescibacteria group bacterium]